MLEILVAREHSFDIDNRGRVDGFDRAHQQEVPIDVSYGHAMDAERVRPVRRARGEDAGERVMLVSARVNLQYVAPRLVQPRHHDDVTPAASPSRAAAANAHTSSHASGAPSEPCRGASSGVLMIE